MIAWEPPRGIDIRVDHGLRAGLSISTFYDPMIAKVIAWGIGREEARRRLTLALEETIVAGLPTNRGFLIACLAKPDFAAEKLSTGFIADHALATGGAAGFETVALAAALIYAREAESQPPNLRYWRSAPWDPETLDLECGSWRGRVGIVAEPSGVFTISGEARSVIVRLPPILGPRCRVEIDGIVETVAAIGSGAELYLSQRGADFVVRELQGGTRQAETGGLAIVRAPMPGLIVAVGVTVGVRVEKGETLLALSAMKMELRLASPVRGIVTAVHASVGAQTPIRKALVEILSD